MHTYLYSMLVLKNVKIFDPDPSLFSMSVSEISTQGFDPRNKIISRLDRVIWLVNFLLFVFEGRYIWTLKFSP